MNPVVTQRIQAIVIPKTPMLGSLIAKPAEKQLSAVVFRVDETKTGFVERITKNDGTIWLRDTKDGSEWPA